MAMKLLGPSLDIHTGGKDLRFPHHENEIAQSEALTGKPFVKVWMHSEFLNVNGEKMSKSLGNFITLRDLVKQGWSPRAIRLFLIGAHYREELNLTDSSMGQADATVRSIDEFYARLLHGQKIAAKGRALSAVKPVNSLFRNFELAMDNDLNTPKALAALFSFQRRINPAIDSKKLSQGDYKLITKALAKVDEVLGVMQFRRESSPVIEDLQQAIENAEIQSLVDQREDARKLKDYARADAIRAQLKARSVAVQDTPEGPMWRRLSTTS